MAENHQMPLQAGGFLESRLGFTAAAHMALSNELFKHIDFDTPLMFSEDLVEGGIRYEPGGFICIPETPGLGAGIPEKILRKLEKISVT
jgi:L-alanine-DL-glutamate epimerase-like enolase superfamily enzyme